MVPEIIGPPSPPPHVQKRIKFGRQITFRPKYAVSKNTNPRKGSRVAEYQDQLEPAKRRAKTLIPTPGE